MSVCHYCDSRGWNHDEMREKCENSLFWFCYYMVSDWVSWNLHEPIADWFQENVENGEHYHLILVPRGHLKTTMFTIAFSVWLAMRDPDIRILLGMSSSRLAREKLQKAQSIVLSENFRHFWGHIVPNPKEVRWNKSEMELIRPVDHEECTISALGADTKMTGGHYNVQILDDLVDGNASNSDVQMQNAIDFFERTDGLWVKRQDALLVIVGTLWPGGYYEEIMRDPDFKKVVIGCYVDDRFRNFMEAQGYDTGNFSDGDPIFPEHETKETLARSARRFKSKFAHQMENLIVDDSLRRFKREDCLTYKWGDDKKESILIPDSDGVDGVYYPVSAMYRQLTIDPSGGRHADSDESAIVVTGWIRGIGVACVLETWCERANTKTQIDMTIELADRWDVQILRPEAGAMQVTFEDYLRDVMTREQRHYAIHPVKPGITSKAQRIIDSLQPFVANRQVYFREDQPDLVEELVNLVVLKGKIRGRSPNMVDALAYHTELWRRSPPSFSDDKLTFVSPEEEFRSYSRHVRYGLECTSRPSRRLSL